MTLISRYLELLNATLAFSLILLILILTRDFKKEFLGKNRKIQIPILLIGFSILLLAFKEVYEYGPFDMVFNPVVAELIETLHLLMTVTAFFCLLRIKDITKIKS